MLDSKQSQQVAEQPQPQQSVDDYEDDMPF